MTTLKRLNNKGQLKKQLCVVGAKVSADDKAQAATHFNVSHATIMRYLRGLVRREAFGLELLAYLKQIIADREKALA